jgi:hypothetical protein
MTDDRDAVPAAGSDDDDDDDDEQDDADGEAEDESPAAEADEEPERILAHAEHRASATRPRTDGGGETRPRGFQRPPDFEATAHTAHAAHHDVEEEQTRRESASSFTDTPHTCE